MPGLICCFPQCGSCSRGNLAVFKITNRTGDFYQEWRKQVLDIVKKCRVFDNDFHRQLDNGRVAICEAHYKKEDIEHTKTGKKTVRLCALPTENLPNTSHPKVITPERRALVRIVNEVYTPSVSVSDGNTTRVCHKDFIDVKT